MLLVATPGHERVNCKFVDYSACVWAINGKAADYEVQNDQVQTLFALAGHKSTSCPPQKNVTCRVDGNREEATDPATQPLAYTTKLSW